MRVQVQQRINLFVRKLVDALIYFFVRLPNNEDGYTKVAVIIQNAINNQYSHIPYTKNSVKTGFTESLIARELNGIFNPDLSVLGENGLQIIHNPRDEKQYRITTQEQLQNMVGEIRIDALNVLQKILDKTPLLAKHMGRESNGEEEICSNRSGCEFFSPH